MPYEDNKSLPSYVHKYSEKVQSQFRHVFNSIYERTGGDEAAAFAGAKSVLKKRVTKHSSDNRDDYVNVLVDSFLKNI